MRQIEALKLIRQMARWETKPTSQQYLDTLAAYNDAMKRFPVTMFTALMDHCLWHHAAAVQPSFSPSAANPPR